MAKTPRVHAETYNELHEGLAVWYQAWSDYYDSLAIYHRAKRDAGPDETIEMPTKPEGLAINPII